MARFEEILVRPWRRGDTRRHYRWPASTLPAHWITPGVDPAIDSQRENWAIDCQGSLVGKITLYDHNRHHLHNPSARLGIYLRPGFYGQGIGSGALNLFFAVCSATYLRLDVAADNERAIRCYKRVGFRELCRIHDSHSLVYIEMERHIAPNRAVSGDTLQLTAD